MNSKSGCMAALVGMLVVGAVLGGMLLYGNLNDAITRRQYAQAALVTAQGQAALDRAQAAATLTASLYPWAILAVIVVAGFVATMALGWAFLTFLDIRHERMLMMERRRELAAPAVQLIEPVRSVNYESWH